MFMKHLMPAYCLIITLIIYTWQGSFLIFLYSVAKKGISTSVNPRSRNSRATLSWWNVLWYLSHLAALWSQVTLATGVPCVYSTSNCVHVKKINMCFSLHTPITSKLIVQQALKIHCYHLLNRTSDYTSQQLAVILFQHLAYLLLV